MRTWSSLSRSTTSTRIATSSTRPIGALASSPQRFGTQRTDRSVIGRSVNRVQLRVASRRTPMTILVNTTSFWNFRAALRFLAGCSFLIVVAHASAADAACPNPVPGSYTAAQINDCLNNDAVVTLTDGAVYTIEQSIVIPANDKTLQGQGGPNRPVLRAVTNLVVPLLVESAKSNFMLKYLVFDGNSGARTNSDACLTSSRPLLGNVRLLGGGGWAVDQVEVANALCHSGMEVFGTSFTIQGSTFLN